MPELPEAERARRALETVVGRRITGVDDRDSYVCRPHPPGAIAHALVGHVPAIAPPRQVPVARDG
jgi:formamidopyrimidine-DNA glycosylase